MIFSLYLGTYFFTLKLKIMKKLSLKNFAQKVQHINKKEMKKIKGGSDIIEDDLEVNLVISNVIIDDLIDIR